MCVGNARFARAAQHDADACLRIVAALDDDADARLTCRQVTTRIASGTSVTRANRGVGTADGSEQRELRVLGHRIGSEAAQVCPVTLRGVEREAIAPNQVRDLAFADHGAREQSNYVSFTKGIAALCRRSAHQQGVRGKRQEAPAHGRGHFDCSN
jgi:hypothetical protein